MLSFDREIITWANHFAQHSWTFDKIMVLIGSNHLLKGGVLLTIVWWGWFRNEDRNSNDRKQIISTMFACIVAMALARGLALALPFRLRPLHEASLQLVPPYGELPTALDGWSSFPSDTSVLFFTLATGLFFISKRAGIFALIYTALFIGIPRIYLCLHYPTDIIGGAVLGITIALLANYYLVRNKYTQAVVDWSYSKPGFFYPLLFLFTYQIADMFENSRALVEGGLKFLKSLIC